MKRCGHPTRREDGICPACWRKTAEGRRYNREAQEAWRIGQGCNVGVPHRPFRDPEKARSAANKRWEDARMENVRKAVA